MSKYFGLHDSVADFRLNCNALNCANRSYGVTEPLSQPITMLSK
jgi:hypothetical protein